MLHLDKVCLPARHSRSVDVVTQDSQRIGALASLLRLGSDCDGSHIVTEGVHSRCQ